MLIAPAPHFLSVIDPMAPNEYCEDAVVFLKPFADFLVVDKHLPNYGCNRLARISADMEDFPAPLEDFLV